VYSSTARSWVGVINTVSLGVSETVKFVARHTKNYDLLRIFNLAIMLSHLGCERAENRIF